MKQCAALGTVWPVPETSLRNASFNFRTLLLPALGFIALLWSLHGFAQAEGYGSLSGQIRITSKLTEQRMRFRLYPDIRPIAAPDQAQQREDEWANIVIYLKSHPSLTGAQTHRLEQNPEMVQLGETFIPHVLPVVRGTTVEFPNQDPIFHNVFSLSGTKSFDLGRYPQGESRGVTFEQTGVAPVFCHLHSDMSAVVMVLDNPYFVIPDPQGRYQLDHIPPGDYTVVAWHERSEQVELPVSIKAGQSVELNITVPLEDDEDSGP